MARRTKEDAETTRSKLLDAAELVFYEKGVSRASLGDIARAAGATRGAVYWHFKDKIDLFHAMMDRVTLPLEGVYLHPQGSDPRDALQRIRAAIWDVLYVVAHDAQVRRVFEIAMYKVEYVEEFAALRERHVGAVQRFCSKLGADLTLAAQHQNVALCMPVAMAAVGLWALFDGILQCWLLQDSDGHDALVLGRQAVDAYLRGLGLSVP